MFHYRKYSNRLEPGYSAIIEIHGKQIVLDGYHRDDGFDLICREAVSHGPLTMFDVVINDPGTVIEPYHETNIV